jgi:hypothetical protein
MSTNEVRDNNAAVARVDMKLEIVVIPVSDVERAKEFYGKLGWRLDADYDKCAAAMPNSARQTPSRANELSISAWVRRRSASATSAMLPSPALYRAVACCSAGQ